MLLVKTIKKCLLNIFYVIRKNRLIDRLHFPGFHLPDRNLVVFGEEAGLYRNIIQYQVFSGSAQAELPLFQAS